MGSKKDETPEAKWSREDSELRTFCIFAEGTPNELPPVGWYNAPLPQQVADEVDKIMSDADGKPYTQATREMCAALWALNNTVLVADNANRRRRELSLALRRVPLAVQLAAHTTRAIRRGVTCTLTESEWLAVYNSFDARCAYCFDAEARTIDHVIPMVAGGAHAVENVVPACKTCNTSKGRQPLEEWLDSRGFNVGRVFARIDAARDRRGT